MFPVPNVSQRYCPARKQLLHSFLQAHLHSAPIYVLCAVILFIYQFPSRCHAICCYIILYYTGILPWLSRFGQDKDDEQMNDPCDHLRVRHTRHNFSFAQHLHRYEYIQLQHQVTSADSPSKYAYSRVTVITSYYARNVQ